MKSQPNSQLYQKYRQNHVGVDCGGIELKTSERNPPIFVLKPSDKNAAWIIAESQHDGKYFLIDTNMLTIKAKRSFTLHQLRIAFALTEITLEQISEIISKKYRKESEELSMDELAKKIGGTY